MKMIGVMDTFGESGEYRELLEKYGLTSNHIVKSAKALLEKRR
jgi:transketolase